jgi:hypothetical protein
VHYDKKIMKIKKKVNFANFFWQTKQQHFLPLSMENEDTMFSCN